METLFDVRAVREQFPALERTYKGQRVAYLDGPGGSQVAQRAIDAVAGYMTVGGANLHGAFVTSRETEELIHEARSAEAQLLGAETDEIAFGHNMTTLALAISRALGRKWDENSEVVVTEIDHRANVDPWVEAATDAGASTRWIAVDPETLTLDLDDLEEKINERTRLVAVNLASNAVGTVNDVAEIARRAHEVGAVVAVDAVHAAAHIPIDRDSLGADILLCSAYKFFGPHVGVAAIKRELFECMEGYKLGPGPTHIPDKLETGTQNHEGIAGVKEAITFVSSLGSGETSRQKVVSGMQAIESYEAGLANSVRTRLDRMPEVTLYAAPDGVLKTPTIAFTVDGYTPTEVCKYMSEKGLFVAGGGFYATMLAEKLGINDSGGWVRIGLAPYNTQEEVDSFLKALEELTE